MCLPLGLMSRMLWKVAWSWTHLQEWVISNEMRPFITRTLTVICAARAHPWAWWAGVGEGGLAGGLEGPKWAGRARGMPGLVDLVGHPGTWKE